MSWHTGQGDSFLDVFNDLNEIALNDSVNTAAPNAGGTSYVVDDILTVAGGTSSPAASTIRVTSVGGSGDVTGVRIETGGSYTADPSLTANAVTGGTGSSCTLDLTMLGNGWTQRLRTQEAVSATIGAIGTGYVVNDTLTLVGGVDVATVATFNVDTVSGSGEVTGVTVVAIGVYDNVVPANDIPTTGGTGTGCELTVTWQNGTGTEQTLLLEGTGSGSDQVFVGIRTYTMADVSGFETVHNWAMFATTAFNAGLTWYQQPGISPGFSNSDGSIQTDGGSFVPLKDTDATFPTLYWFSITPRRILGIVKVEDAIETHYASWYIGFTNAFGTASEFPYPIYVAGCTSRENAFWSDTQMGRMSNLAEALKVIGKDGPGWYRRQDQQWQDVQNAQASDTGSNSRSALKNYTVYPMGQTTIEGTGPADIVVSNGSALDWALFIPNSGIPGVPTMKLQPTPHAAGDLRMLIPCTIVASEDDDGSIDIEIIGEIDNVYWLTGVLGMSAEDTMDISGERYTIFPNGNRNDEWAFMAILEN